MTRAIRSIGWWLWVAYNIVAWCVTETRDERRMG